MRPWLLLVVLGCGDNTLPVGEPLAPAPELAIVAHQDDDLLFMQPELLAQVQAGTGVTIVYVTAGDDDRGLEYAQRRYAGVRAAYSSVTGREDWSCGWIEVAGHAAEHCRLAPVGLSLVFLGYPDGGRQGQLPSSLLALWTHQISGAETIAERSSHYDRAALIATLSTVVERTAPQTIHTLEVAATHGDDHADHEIVGALAVIATGGAVPLYSSRGYNINSEPANVSADRVSLADAAFAHYAACAEGCAPCGTACPAFSPTYAGYLERSYPILIDRELPARLELEGVTIDPRTLPVDYDDEGHLWLTTAPTDATATAHLDCLGVVDGEAQAMACGGGNAPAWALAQ